MAGALNGAAPHPASHDGAAAASAEASRPQRLPAGLARDLRIIRRRLAQALPVVLAIVILNFFLLRLIPGDLVDVLVADSQGATPEYIAELKRTYGLDKPLLHQLLIYLESFAQLDLGYSYRYNAPVLELILGRLPSTILLMTSSIGLAFIGGMTLGILAARRVNSQLDNAVALASLMFFATPSFWIALMMIVLFSVKLGWLPIGGMTTIGGVEGGALAQALDVLHHLVLPSLSLSLIFVAIYTRLMRASMLEVLGQDFVRAIRAKGVSEARLTIAHVLRNALLPMVTFVGLQTANLLGGAIVIETVFGWPGMGRLAYDAVMQRDFNLLLGILFMSSLLVVTVNLAVDLLYARLDPRIEMAAKP